ncbi:hypothetical protein F2Q68_00007437 [Brassica cretica]|uniref:Uncharacterized protein n=1 Tax=Brassica cretica TaxID=69181 RepID=A0A8S9L4M2_BRACR|nr:hypothetical protein F2Q68_00007437 [Brassica cretica]
MDAMRKQLDVLMGANRNGDVTEVNRKYYDRDVCRLYLSGLCPHELFQLTRFIVIIISENGYGSLPKGGEKQSSQGTGGRKEVYFPKLVLGLLPFNVFAEKLLISGQRRGAEIENQVKKETEEIAVTVEEMLTVGVEIATGIMTTVNMTETMTQEAGGTGPGLGKDTGIMITAADAMTATKTLPETVAAGLRGV